MTNRTRYGIALGLVLLTVLVLLVVRLADRTGERIAKFEGTFRVMGTVAKFTFYGPPEAAREAADRAGAVHSFELVLVYHPVEKDGRNILGKFRIIFVP